MIEIFQLNNQSLISDDIQFRILIIIFLIAVHECHMAEVGQ